MRRRCLSCGAEYDGRPDSTLCPACAAKSKAGAVVRDRICRQCGCTFKGGPRAWYCPDCRLERRRAVDRRIKRTGPARPLGSTDFCEICGQPYEVMSGRQRYCPICAAKHLQEVDRAQSRAWNHDNVDLQEQKRQRHEAVAERPCAICGKLFRPGNGGPVTCSPECRKIYKAQKSAAYEQVHRAERNAYRRNLRKK